MALTDKLTAIADAIRAKTGGADVLTLDEMVTEIGGIEAGGGISIDDVAVRNFTSIKINTKTIGDYAFAHCKLLKEVEGLFVENIGDYAFYGCTSLDSVNMPELLEIPSKYAFSGNTKLTEISFSKLSRPGDNTFAGCTSLKNVNLPSAVYVGTNMLSNTVIESINLPSVTLLYTTPFANCTQLKSVDFGSIVDFNRASTFKGCTNLKTIIMRGNGVSSLPYTNCFTDTPFAEGGTGGTIYVPEALIEQYQTATNWSTLYAAGTCNFVAIEGSEYE